MGVGVVSPIDEAATRDAISCRRSANVTRLNPFCENGPKFLLFPLVG